MPIPSHPIHACSTDSWADARPMCMSTVFGLMVRLRAETLADTDPSWAASDLYHDAVALHEGTSFLAQPGRVWWMPYDSGTYLAADDGVAGVVEDLAPDRGTPMFEFTVFRQGWGSWMVAVARHYTRQSVLDSMGACLAS